MLTGVGPVTVRRRYFWSRGWGGQCPVDEPLGIQDRTVTRGALRMVCTVGVMEDFAQAAEDLYTLAGLRVSAERLRQLVEAEGRRVGAAYFSEALAPGWRADEAARVYVGVDGVKVRSITEAEKRKRRRQHEARRRQREQAGVGNPRPLPAPSAGTTDTFKEMKIGLFYDQAKAHVFTFATAQNHRGFGERLAQAARGLGLSECRTVVSITDGAPWIRNRLLEHLPYLDAMLLDFYHFSEHVWDTAQCCLGETHKARWWAAKQLHEIAHVGPAGVLAAIDTLSKKMRSPRKKKRLRLLREYLVQRWEMVDYPGALARGWDIGSGPTEAMCKNLTLRLKRTGMKWDPANAEALMNLMALRESHLWQRWWSRPAA